MQRTMKKKGTEWRGTRYWGKVSSTFPPLPTSGGLGRGAGRDLCPRPQINRPRKEGAKAGNANMEKCMTGQSG